MADTAHIDLSGGAEEHGFYAIGRARVRSKATASVEYGGQLALLGLDIALGEPNAERPILQIDRPGTFSLPGLVEAQELVSVRARHLPTGTVTIVIQFEPVA